MSKQEFHEKLLLKIMKLSQNIWEYKVDKASIDLWLNNFNTGEDISDCEQSHALYLLSNFMFFGVREIREMLKSMYRDKVKNPLMQQARKDLVHTTDVNAIKRKFDEEMKNTKFLGIGNPSESGTHLLYFFRQENKLPKEQFIHSHEIIQISEDNNEISLRDKAIKRYIFIDDLCGSGDQATDYSNDFLGKLKNIAPNIELHYITLFSTSQGLKNLKKNTVFDKVECIFELDETYKCFSEKSRYFPKNIELPVTKVYTENFARSYAKDKLFWDDDDALGYCDGQLLLGFSHNTPDNTLPIFWEEFNNWQPIFKRYSKQSSS